MVAGGTVVLKCQVEDPDDSSLQWSNPAQQTLYFGEKRGVCAGRAEGRWIGGEAGRPSPPTGSAAALIAHPSSPCRPPALRDNRIQLERSTPNELTISISDVVLSDEGEYTCSIFTMPVRTAKALVTVLGEQRPPPISSLCPPRAQDAPHVAL